MKIATDEEKIGTPAPAHTGRRIDLIVYALNGQFGKRRIAVGLNAIKACPRSVLPTEVIGIVYVNVIYQVKESSPEGPDAIKRRVVLRRLEGR